MPIYKTIVAVIEVPDGDNDETALNQISAQGIRPEHIQFLSVRTGVTDVAQEAGADETTFYTKEPVSILLVTGNPADGFTYYGPVLPNTANLEEFTDGALADEYWWYVPVSQLPRS